MSFLSDLFSGNVGNLGTDITHSFDSQNLTQTLEGIGAVGLTALTAGGAIPALGGALGLGAAGGDIATGGLAAGVPGLDLGTAFAADADALPLASAPALGDTTFLPTSFAGGDFPSLAAQSASVSDPLAGGTGTVINPVTTSGDTWATGVSGAANSVSGAGTDDTLGGLMTGPNPPASSLPGAQTPGVWDKLVSGIQGAPSAALNSVTGNPLGVAAAGAGLGYDIYENKKAQNTPAIQNLNSIATQQQAQGAQLENYLATGTLPPGLQQMVANNVAAAKAQIISHYASQGLSTNPTQNSALAQELAAVDAQSTAMTAQVAQGLLSSGVSETGLSSQIYQTLAGIDQTQTAQIGNAISSMAAALSGKSQIKTGTNANATTITVG